MPMEQKVSFCRICEAHCGMLATVEDGRVTKLRPDPEHPLSKGFACPKGIAMTQVQNDPDRVVHPLRRRDDGQFERVSWEAALDEIGSPHSYTASSQDVSNRFAASSFLYGSPFLVPIPDLARTDLLFMVGAN